MVKIHKIESVYFDSGFLCIKTDGKTYKVRLELVSEKLRNADTVKREMYTISPAGYGIHWPLIDEDLSVEQLLKLAES